MAFLDHPSTFKLNPSQEVEGKAKVEMSSNTTIAALERKYIELLEKKISRLESEDFNTQSKTLSLVGQ